MYLEESLRHQTSLPGARTTAARRKAGKADPERARWDADVEEWSSVSGRPWRPGLRRAERRGESDLLTAILRRRSSAPSVEDRLAYVRELYGPGRGPWRALRVAPGLSPREAVRRAVPGVPGRGDCPEKGMVSTVVEETWGRARRFSVRMGSCVSADRERRRASLPPSSRRAGYPAAWRGAPSTPS